MPMSGLGMRVLKRRLMSVIKKPCRHVKLRDRGRKRCGGGQASLQSPDSGESWVMAWLACGALVAWRTGRIGRRNLQGFRRELRLEPLRVAPC